MGVKQSLHGGVTGYLIHGPLDVKLEASMGFCRYLTVQLGMPIHDLDRIVLLPASHQDIIILGKYVQCP